MGHSNLSRVYVVLLHSLHPVKFHFPTKTLLKNTEQTMLYILYCHGIKSKLGFVLFTTAFIMNSFSTEILTIYYFVSLSSSNLETNMAS